MAYVDEFNHKSKSLLEGRNEKFEELRTEEEQLRRDLDEKEAERRRVEHERKKLEEKVAEIEEEMKNQVTNHEREKTFIRENDQKDYDRMMEQKQREIEEKAKIMEEMEVEGCALAAEMREMKEKVHLMETGVEGKELFQRRIKFSKDTHDTSY